MVKITGYNSKRLTEIAERTLAKVERNRRVRNPRITGSERFGRTTNEETLISLRRDVLADHGLTVLEVVATVRRLLGLDTPWSMLVEGEQQQVRLQFLGADSFDVSALFSEVIKDSGGGSVQLGDLVTIETVPLSDAIVRENQRYSMLVNWEYVGTNHMRMSYIESIIDTMDLPYGYAAEESQRQFLTEEEESDLLLTTILAAVFILMVLMALFESFTLPFLVLTSLPMALVGVFVTFEKAGTAFDSSAQIGLVLLFGVVVNNAILLVSRFPFRDRPHPASAPGRRPGARRGSVRRLAAAPRRRRPLLPAAAGAGASTAPRHRPRHPGTPAVDSAHQRDDDHRPTAAARPDRACSLGSPVRHRSSLPAAVARHLQPGHLAEPRPDLDRRPAVEHRPHHPGPARTISGRRIHGLTRVKIEHELHARRRFDGVTSIRLMGARWLNTQGIRV